MNDNLRAAIIALAQSLFPVLVIAGVLALDETQISVIMLFVTNAVTVIALALKNGQEEGPPV